MSQFDNTSIGDHVVTANGLILEVVDSISADTHLESESWTSDEFFFSRAVGRTNGNNEDLPKNVFIHRVSDGMRFKQAGDESRTNLTSVYEELAPAPTAAEWVAAWTTAAVSTATPPEGSPEVGDRAETANGLVIEVTNVALVDGQWVVFSKAVGRSRRAPEHVRGRELPKNEFKHAAMTGARIDSRLTQVNTDVVAQFDGTPPFDYAATRVDEAAPAAVAAPAPAPRANWGVIDDGRRA